MKAQKHTKNGADASKVRNPTSKTKKRQLLDSYEAFDQAKAKWICKEDFGGIEHLDTLDCYFATFVQSSLKSFINDTRKDGVDSTRDYPTYRDDLARNIIRKLGLVHPSKSSEPGVLTSNAAGVEHMETSLGIQFSTCQKVSDVASVRKSKRIQDQRSKRYGMRTRQRSLVVEEECESTGQEQEGATSTESSSFEDEQDDVCAVMGICNQNTEQSLVVAGKDPGQHLDYFRYIATGRNVPPEYWRMMILRKCALDNICSALDEKDRMGWFRYANGGNMDKVRGLCVPDDLRTFEGLSGAKITADEIKRFLEFTRPKVDHLGPFVDKPALKGLKMPLMPPPAPIDALRRCRSISVYTNLSSRQPGRISWGSTKLAPSSLRHMQNIATQKVTGDVVSRTSEAVYTVALYKPTKTYSEISAFIPCHQLPSLACKIEILGQQSLTDLRKQMYCATDFLGEKVEVDSVDELDSNVFELPKNHREKVLKNPCAFVIGDHVYENSTDGPNGMNYTQWHKHSAKQQFRKVSPNVQVNMNNTRIDSLELKIGFPYVFIHNETCEHVVVFEEVSLLKPQNPVVQKSTYPKLTTYTLKTKVCEVDMTPARYAASHSPLMTNHTAFLCQDCMVDCCFMDGHKYPGVTIRPYIADPGRNHFTSL